MAGYPGGGGGPIRSNPNQYHNPYIPANMLQSIYQQKNSEHPHRPAPSSWTPERVQNYYGHHVAANRRSMHLGVNNVPATLSMVIPQPATFSMVIPQPAIRGGGVPNAGAVSRVANAGLLKVPVPNNVPAVQGTGGNVAPGSSSHQSSRKRTRDTQDNQHDIKKKRTQNSAATSTPSTSTHSSQQPSSSLSSHKSHKRTHRVTEDDLIASAVQEYISQEVEDYINSDDSDSSSSEEKSKQSVPKNETHSSKKNKPSSSRTSDQRTTKSSKNDDSIPSTSTATLAKPSHSSDKDSATPFYSIDRTGVKRKAGDTLLSKSAPAAVQVKQRPRLDAVGDEDCVQLLDTPTSSRQASNQRRNSLPAAGEDVLSQQIMERYNENKQRDSDLARKEDMRAQLEKIIHEVMPYTMLFLVGSSKNCFGSRTSDADMCLMVSDGELNQKRDAKNILYQIKSYLQQRCQFVKHLQVIPAKVPIIKFSHKYSGLECDLNINNATGIRNTHLLQAYAKLDPRVAPLVLMIKLWAGANGINDASQGTLSSYSIVLMVLNYLQVRCYPPVLPALQQRYPNIFTKYSDVRQFQSISPTSGLPANIRYQSQNKQDVGNLLRGFFEYYGKEFKFNTSVMSIRMGKVLHLKEVIHTRGDWLNKFILIEEPFDESNTARAVYTIHKFGIIKRRFAEAASKFKQGGPSMKLNKVMNKS